MYREKWKVIGILIILDRKIQNNIGHKSWSNPTLNIKYFICNKIHYIFLYQTSRKKYETSKENKKQ